MKIIALADIHTVSVDIPKGDLTIIAGDFTISGPIDFAERFLDKIEGRILAVPGNMDPEDVLNVLEVRNASIHRKVVEIEGIKFFGFGGSTPTPQKGPFELDDKEIEEIISRFEADIAIFHDTPYGFFDWVKGKSVGSMAIRKWIERIKPKIVFCGHMHEHEGVAKLNETIIVKLPPAYKKRCAIVEFENLNIITVRFANLKP